MRFLAVCGIAAFAANLAWAADLPIFTSSGYLKTGPEENDAELFYLYYEAQEPTLHIVDDTPVLVWLNGGPGCSSMIGNFYEIGPQRLSTNGSLVNFDYTWNKKYALLFIDQPVGTGLSVGNETPRTQSAITSQLFNALVDFFRTKPSLKARPVFLAGESYAGHYIPSLANMILGRSRDARSFGSLTRLQAQDIMNKHSQGDRAFNFAGVIIGSGLTEPKAQVETHADVMHALGLIDDEQRARARTMQQQVVRYIDRHEWDRAHRSRDDLLNYLEEASGVATLLDVRRKEPYRDNIVAEYLNTPEVREAIHAKPGIMDSCSKDIPSILTNDIMKGFADEVAEIVRHVPVLLFQGQFDVKDGYPSTVAWLKNLPWEGTPHFQAAKREIWMLEGERVGYWKQYGRLAHAVVLNAGHMVPHDAPHAALDMIHRFVDSSLDSTEEN